MLAVSSPVQARLKPVDRDDKWTQEVSRTLEGVADKGCCILWAFTEFVAALCSLQTCTRRPTA